MFTRTRLEATARAGRVHAKLPMVIGACSWLLVSGSAGCDDATHPRGEQAQSPVEAGSAPNFPDASGSQQPGSEGGTIPAQGAEAGTPEAGTHAPFDAGSNPQATADGGTAPIPGACGVGPSVLTPFGCRFAWGTNDPMDKMPGGDRLGFVTKWVGYETDKAGNLARCDGCSWLPQFKNKASVPAYYAYFIGFLGAANGFVDQNVNPDGPNLATDGAQLIRTQRAKIIELYASYARQSAQVFPDKPLVWLLEGDFVQYTYKEQKQALTMQELGELAHDITCAIKANMPKAVVAINHSTWLSNDVTNALWETMAAVDYDMVWTTGVANNDGFFEKDAKPGIYNEATATYAYLAQKTGRKIFVDTSFGLSGMADSWSSATPAVLNARIADGVIAANVTMPPSGYVAATEALAAQLSAVCQ